MFDTDTLAPGLLPGVAWSQFEPSGLLTDLLSGLDVGRLDADDALETAAAWERLVAHALPKARAISEATEVLDKLATAAVQSRVLPRAATQTVGELRAALSRAVLAVDPDAANRRHRTARNDRRVQLHPHPDGMGAMWALLPADDVTAAYARLDALARGMDADDPRGMDARRADIFTDLLLGRDVRGEKHTTVEVQVNLDAATLVGLADNPGELAGYGPIPADESEHRSERVRRAFLQNAQQGRRAGGPRPFGYEDDGVTVREPEAAAVRAAVESVLAGASLRSVGRDLTATGLTTTLKSRAWDAHAVRALLVRPRNAGLRQHQGQVIGPANWPAIVPEEHWRAVVAIVTDPGVPAGSAGGGVTDYDHATVDQIRLPPQDDRPIAAFGVVPGEGEPVRVLGCHQRGDPSMWGLGWFLGLVSVWIIRARSCSAVTSSSFAAFALRSALSMNNFASASPGDRGRSWAVVGGNASSPGPVTNTARSAAGSAPCASSADRAGASPTRPPGGTDRLPAAVGDGGSSKSGDQHAVPVLIGSADPSDPISVSRLAQISPSWLSNWPMGAKWVDIWFRRWSIAASLASTSPSVRHASSLAASALMVDKATAVETVTVDGA